MLAQWEKAAHPQWPLRHGTELLPVLSPTLRYSGRREWGEAAGEVLCSPLRAGGPGSPNQGPHWVFGQDTSRYWSCSAPNRRQKGNLPLHF